MFDEETSVMMHQANLDLFDHLSSNSQALHRQRNAAVPAKVKPDSGLGVISSRSLKRLSAFLPRSDTSHNASPHPTKAQPDPHGSSGSGQGSQDIISAVLPPAEVASGSNTTTTISATNTGDAPDNASSGGGPIVTVRNPPITHSKMLLSDLYKSTKSPLSRFRSHPHSAPMDLDTEYDADLISRDKMKQKEAVKRHLAERIRNDWDFKWPPSPVGLAQGGVAEEKVVGNANDDADRGQQPADDYAVADSSPEEEGDDDDTISNYSTVSEDLDHFRSRAEWLSDFSEDEPTTSSAYRYDNPDAVGTAVGAGEFARSAKRRKAVRDEMQWNSGLACFNARRDAWTGAKTVRVRTKCVTPPTVTPASPPSTSKRLSWFRLSSAGPTVPLPDLGGVAIPISPTGTQISGDTLLAVSSASSDGEPRGEARSSTGTGIDTDTRTPHRHDYHYKVQTLLPVPPPLLPPANPMRASITPTSYPSIYDKIVVHSMTPACPINLHDVIRSCVTGWKRDGEWPLAPRQTVSAVATSAPVLMAARKKKKETSATTTTAGTGARNGSGASAKPNAARRLSLVGFLGRKEQPTTVAAASAPAPAASPRKDRRQSSTTTGGTSSKSLRKSLQRVLGLGHDRLANTVALG